MNLNELIKALQDIQKEHGDVLVLDAEGYTVSPVTCVVNRNQSIKWDMNEGETFVCLEANC